MTNHYLSYWKHCFLRYAGAANQCGAVTAEQQADPSWRSSRPCLQHAMPAAGHASRMQRGAPIENIAFLMKIDWNYEN